MIEENFVQNPEVSRGFGPWTPILMLKIGNILHLALAFKVHFAAISIFRRFPVFFRGNYFFQVLAPLSVYMGSHPPGLNDLRYEWVTFFKYMVVEGVGVG